MYKSILDSYKMFTFQEDGPTLGIDIGLPYCCDKLATRIHHRAGTPGVDFPMISRQWRLCGNAKKWNMVDRTLTISLNQTVNLGASVTMPCTIRNLVGVVQWTR